MDVVGISSYSKVLLEWAACVGHGAVYVLIVLGLLVGPGGVALLPLLAGQLVCGLVPLG